jgi:hypothetical protein
MRIVKDSLWSTLHELTATQKPDWQKVSGSWVNAWVQSGGTPVESKFQALGAFVRGHALESMIREIGQMLSFHAEMELEAAQLGPSGLK